MTDIETKYRSSEYRELAFDVYVKGNRIVFYDKPTENADHIVITMWEMNCAIWEMLERQCQYYEEGEHGEMQCFDYFKMRMLYLRTMFRSWNLDADMTFLPDGTLDDVSYERLLRLHPDMLSRISDAVFNYALSEKDEERLVRQSMLLFGKSGKVSNPHPMVSMYCFLAEMWDKFGLNYFDLMRLPLPLKNWLRRMSQMEGQMRKTTKA